MRQYRQLLRGRSNVKIIKNNGLERFLNRFWYNKKNKLKEGIPKMGKIEVINHPLIQHKLSILRRTDTSTKAFRELVNEIAMLMGYEGTS